MRSTLWTLALVSGVVICAVLGDAWARETELRLWRALRPLR